MSMLSVKALFNGCPNVLMTIQCITYEVNRYRMELSEFRDRGDDLLASYALADLLDRLDAIEKYLDTGLL